MPDSSRVGRVELLGEELAQPLHLVRAPLELDARVEVLGVLADDHQVGLRKAGAHPLVGLARPDARIEVELLAQRDVDRAVARAHGRGGRALDRDPALADRVEGPVGERVALLLVDVDAGVLEVPVELDAGGLEHAPGRLGELGPGAVARDEGHAVCQTVLSVSGGPHSDNLRRPAPATISRAVFGGGSIQLARVFGIRIGVDVSWFFVLFLIIWSLSGYYGDVFPGEDAKASCWPPSARCCSSSRSCSTSSGTRVVAIRNGIPISGIDLWMFGGVAKLERDTDSPGVEFRVAVAGPLVTLAIARALLRARRGDLGRPTPPRRLALRGQRDRPRRPRCSATWPRSTSWCCSST